MMTESRPPLPPFTYDEAVIKVRKAEDAWNKQNSEGIALAYTIDSIWRNRSEFPKGRAQIIEFLTRIDSSKKFGPTAIIVLQFALSMSGTTAKGNGIDPMAMKIGSLMNMD